MNMEKLLSIIVPAYNVEKYLEKTLDSCEINDKEIQKKYEVIIVKDGSVDNTHNIAQKYVDKYADTETFRIIDKENGGYGSTINIGIKVAYGKYIKILDGDDWYNTVALKQLINLLGDTKSDAVLTDYTSVHDCTGEHKLYHYDLTPNILLDTEQITNVPQNLEMHAICYRTDIFRKYKITITEHCFYTDTEFLLYPLPYVKTIQYYPLDLYQYRIGREGQSVSPTQIIAHTSDQELLMKNMNAYFNREIPDRNKTLISKRMSIVYGSYIIGLLLSPCCKSNHKKLKEFIRLLKSKHHEQYKDIVNKKIVLLENSTFLVYWLCCMWHRKIERKR